MKKYFLLTAVISFFSAVQGQVHTTKIIHQGASITDASNFLFPSFGDALVKQNTNSFYKKMNFNLLINQFQFINENNDTLELFNPADVDSILLNNNVFFYKDGYYQIVTASDSVKLSILRKVSYEVIKIGAMGLANHGSGSIQSYRSIFTNAGQKNLLANENIEVTIETVYYLIINNTAFIKANKAAFFKVFAAKQEKIKDWLKQNKTDFNKQADLIKLFDFCVQ